MTRSSEPAGPPAFDRDALRSALGLFATGVTVVSALDAAGEPRGMTANGFMSASLDPPLVLVSVRHGARFHEVVSGAGAYGVSILPERLEREARRFAGLPVAESDPTPRFVERQGVPLLDGALVQIAARTVERHIAGDHTLFVGEVLDVVSDRSVDPPLVFFRSSFAGLVPGREPPLDIDPWGWSGTGWGAAGEHWG